MQKSFFGKSEKISLFGRSLPSSCFRTIRTSTEGPKKGFYIIECLPASLVKKLEKEEGLPIKTERVSVIGGAYAEEIDLIRPPVASVSSANDPENNDGDNNDESEMRIIKPLGEGAFGRVFLGYFENKLVAIKEIDVKEPKQREQFEKESAILTFLNTQKDFKRHLGALQGTYIPTQQKAYLVMPLVKLGTLADLIKLIRDTREKQGENSRLTLLMQWKLIIDITLAINRLHQAGIYHGDLKPENILLDEGLDEGPCIKIADFGCSIDTNKAEIKEKINKKEGDLWILRKEGDVGDIRYLKQRLPQYGQYYNLSERDSFAFQLIVFQIATGCDLELKTVEKFDRHVPDFDGTLQARQRLIEENLTIIKEKKRRTDLENFLLELFGEDRPRFNLTEFLQRKDVEKRATQLKEEKIPLSYFQKLLVNPSNNFYEALAQQAIQKKYLVECNNREFEATDLQQLKDRLFQTIKHLVDGPLTKLRRTGRLDSSSPALPIDKQLSNWIKTIHDSSSSVLALVGEAFSGKTTLIAQWMEERLNQIGEEITISDNANKKPILPIYIDLNQVKDTGQLKEYIEKKLKLEGSGKFQLLEEAFSIVIICDNFSKLPSLENLHYKNLGKLKQLNLIILTETLSKENEDIFLNPFSAPDGKFSSLRLDPLSDADVLSFIRENKGEKPGFSPENTFRIFKRIGMLPTLGNLKFVLGVLAHEGGKIPSDLIDLFEIYLDTYISSQLQQANNLQPVVDVNKEQIFQVLQNSIKEGFSQADWSPGFIKIQNPISFKFSEVKKTFEEINPTSEDTALAFKKIAAFLPIVPFEIAGNDNGVFYRPMSEDLISFLAAKALYEQMQSKAWGKQEVMEGDVNGDLHLWLKLNPQDIKYQKVIDFLVKHAKRDESFTKNLFDILYGTRALELGQLTYVHAAAITILALARELNNKDLRGVKFKGTNLVNGAIINCDLDKAIFHGAFIDPDSTRFLYLKGAPRANFLGAIWLNRSVDLFPIITESHWDCSDKYLAQVLENKRQIRLLEFASASFSAIIDLARLFNKDTPNGWQENINSSEMENHDLAPDRQPMSDCEIVWHPIYPNIFAFLINDWDDSGSYKKNYLLVIKINDSGDYETYKFNLSEKYYYDRPEFAREGEQLTLILTAVEEMQSDTESETGEDDKFSDKSPSGIDNSTVTNGARIVEIISINLEEKKYNYEKGIPLPNFDSSGDEGDTYRLFTGHGARVFIACIQDNRTKIMEIVHKDEPLLAYRCNSGKFDPDSLRVSPCGGLVYLTIAEGVEKKSYSLYHRIIDLTQPYKMVPILVDGHKSRKYAVSNQALCLKYNYPRDSRAYNFAAWRPIPKEKSEAVFVDNLKCCLVFFSYNPQTKQYNEKTTYAFSKSNNSNRERLTFLSVAFSQDGEKMVLVLNRKKQNNENTILRILSFEDFSVIYETVFPPLKNFEAERKKIVLTGYHVIFINGKQIYCCFPYLGSPIVNHETLLSQKLGHITNLAYEPNSNQLLVASAGNDRHVVIAYDLGSGTIRLLKDLAKREGDSAPKTKTTTNTLSSSLSHGNVSAQSPGSTGGLTALSFICNSKPDSANQQWQTSGINERILHSCQVGTNQRLLFGEKKIFLFFDSEEKFEVLFEFYNSAPKTVVLFVEKNSNSVKAGGSANLFVARGTEVYGFCYEKGALKFITIFGNLSKTPMFAGVNLKNTEANWPLGIRQRCDIEELEKKEEQMLQTADKLERLKINWCA